jgi:hypothetical protein
VGCTVTHSGMARLESQMKGLAYLGDRQNTSISLRRVLSLESGLDTGYPQQHVSESARVDSCEGARIHDDNAVCGPRGA